MNNSMMSNTKVEENQKEINLNNGFSLREKSLYHLEYDKETKTYVEQLLGRGLWIEKVSQDIENHEVSLLLKYWFKDKLNEITISRKYLEVNELKKLLSKGVDVPDHKVKKVAKYLSIQEEEAPYEYTHEKVGWGTFENKLVYKHYQLIGSSDIQSTFSGQLSLKPKGTLKGWKTIVENEVIGTTNLELALTFGFSAPVVGLMSKEMDLDTLIIHLYGDTTKGKTTAVRVAAAPFGKPSDKENGLIGTWNGTLNALIGKLADNSGLPFILDEASMKSKTDFTSMIYTIASGSEKARMSKEAQLREQQHWTTTVISTAEHSLLEKSKKNAGLSMRVFEFGNESWTTSASNADALKNGLNQHYGHAGVVFIKYLIEKGKDYILDKWQNWSRECYNKMTSVDRLSHRIADKLAILLTTAELVNESLELQLSVNRILEFLIEKEEALIGNWDIGEKAFHYFQEKMVLHRAKFKGDHFDERSTECWGAITSKGQMYEVAILKDKFNSLMREGDFEDSQIILSNWAEKGYLDKDETKRTRKRVIDKSQADFQDGRSLVYCIKVNKNIFDLSGKDSNVRERKNSSVLKTKTKNLFDE